MLSGLISDRETGTWLRVAHRSSLLIIGFARTDEPTRTAV
jgi:hypothetical protein